MTVDDIQKARIDFDLCVKFLNDKGFFSVKKLAGLNQETVDLIRTLLDRALEQPEETITMTKICGCGCPIKMEYASPLKL